MRRETFKLNRFIVNLTEPKLYFLIYVIGVYAKNPLPLWHTFVCMPYNKMDYLDSFELLNYCDITNIIKCI